MKNGSIAEVEAKAQVLKMRGLRDWQFQEGEIPSRRLSISLRALGYSFHRVVFEGVERSLRLFIN